MYLDTLQFQRLVNVREPPVGVVAGTHQRCQSTVLAYPTSSTSNMNIIRWISWSLKQNNMLDEGKVKTSHCTLSGDGHLQSTAPGKASTNKNKTGDRIALQCEDFVTKPN